MILVICCRFTSQIDSENFGELSFGWKYLLVQWMSWFFLFLKTWVKLLQDLAKSDLMLCLFILLRFFRGAKQILRAVADKLDENRSTRIAHQMTIKWNFRLAQLNHFDIGNKFETTKNRFCSYFTRNKPTKKRVNSKNHLSSHGVNNDTEWEKINRKNYDAK